MRIPFGRVLVVVFLAAGYLLMPIAHSATLHPIQFNASFGNLPVQLNEIFLSGRVVNASSEVSLQINGQSVPVVDATWMYLASLKPGVNQFEISLTEEEGNVHTETFNVTAEAPLRLSEVFRDRILILPVVANDLTTYRTDLFSLSLSETIGGFNWFRIVERSHLDNVLREHHLKTVDLAETRNAVRVGKLLLAKHILLLRIMEATDSMAVAVRLVEVATQQVIWAARYQAGLVSDDTPERLGKGIALDVGRLFCSQRAIIVDVSEWPSVYIDKAFSHGVRESVLVAPATEAEGVGAGRIVEVQDAFSIAVMDATRSFLSPGDSVNLYGYMNTPE